MILFILNLIASLGDATIEHKIEQSTVQEFYESCIAFAVNSEDCKKSF